MAPTGRGALDALLSTSFISLLQELLALLRQAAAFVAERRLQGIYDVLEQRRTVTIHDAGGRVATVDTVQHLRFRQNHIAALVDYVWGDGDILAAYTCSPGVPVDCHKEGSRHVVLISLRGLRNSGETLWFRTQRRILRGFTRPEECWESDFYHRTGRAEVRIIFPRQRPCRKAAISLRNAGKMTALGPQHFHRLPGGQQELVWAIKRPNLHERYLLHWEW